MSTLTGIFCGATIKNSLAGRSLLRRTNGKLSRLMDFLMLASDGRKVESDFDEGREVCLDIKLA